MFLWKHIIWQQSLSYCPLSCSRMHLKNDFIDQLLPLKSEIHFAHTYTHTYTQTNIYTHPCSAHTSFLKCSSPCLDSLLASLKKTSHSWTKKNILKYMWQKTSTLVFSNFVILAIFSYMYFIQISVSFIIFHLEVSVNNNYNNYHWII